MLFQLKTISFLGRPCSVICQNENGPCPLIAIANILILQRRIVLDQFAVQITLDNLVILLVNLMMSEIDDREARGKSREDKFEFTPEMSVFDLLNIKVFHGWLVDPKGDPLTVRVMSNLSHTNAMLKLVEFRTLSDRIKASSDISRPIDLKEEDKELIRAGLTIDKFFAQTATQLTTCGLHTLYNVLTDRQLAVFFRNNHFSTLFSYNGQLFNLVTDTGYLHEHTVVWEVLDGIDGSSEFYNSTFDPLSAYKVSDYSDYSPPPAAANGDSAFKASFYAGVVQPPTSTTASSNQSKFTPTPAYNAPSRQDLANRGHYLGTYTSPLHAAQSNGQPPSTPAQITSAAAGIKNFPVRSNPAPTPALAPAAPTSSPRNIVAPASVISSGPPPSSYPVSPPSHHSQSPAMLSSKSQSVKPLSHAPLDDDDMMGSAAPVAPIMRPMTSQYGMQASPIANAQKQLLRTASMDAKQFNNQNNNNNSNVNSQTGLNVAVPESQPSEPSPIPSNRNAAPLQRSPSASQSTVPKLDLNNQQQQPQQSSLSVAAQAQSSVMNSQRQLLRTASKRGMEMDPNAPINYPPMASGSPQISPRPQNTPSNDSYPSARSLNRSSSENSNLPPPHHNNQNAGNLMRAASTGEVKPNLPLSRLEMQQMQLLNAQQNSFNSTGSGGNSGSGGTPERSASLRSFPIVRTGSHDQETNSVTSGGSRGSSSHNTPKGRWTSDNSSPQKEVYISRYGANSNASPATSYTEQSSIYANNLNYNNNNNKNYNGLNHSSSSDSQSSGLQSSPGKKSVSGREHSNAIKTAINTIINSNSNAIPNIINTIIDNSSNNSVSSTNSGSHQHIREGVASTSSGNTPPSSGFSQGIANKFSYDDEDLRMNDAPYRATQALSDPKPMSHEDEDYLMALRLQQEMNSNNPPTVNQSTNVNTNTNTASTIAPTTATGSSPMPQLDANGLPVQPPPNFDVLRYGSSSQARGASPMGPTLGRQNSGGTLQRQPSNSSNSGHNQSSNSLQSANSQHNLHTTSSSHSLHNSSSNSLPVATVAAPAPSSPTKQKEKATIQEDFGYLSPSEIAEQRAVMQQFEKDKRKGSEPKKKFLGLF